MPLRFSLRLLALSLALVTPAVLPAQEPNPLHTATRQELSIIKVLLAQENAWNRATSPPSRAVSRTRPTLSSSPIKSPAGSPALLEEYKHDYPNKAAMGTLSYSDLEVHPLDENFAVVIGKYHLERGKKDGGNVEGLFSLVVENTDNGWKIVIDHTT